MDENIDISRFREVFKSEEDCYNFLFQIRWPNGFICPDCNHDKYWEQKNRKIYECTNCKNQISLTSGTIFHATRIPLADWFLMIFLFEKDLSVSSVKELLKIKSYETVWSISKKIKEGKAKEGDFRFIESIIGRYEEVCGKIKRNSIDTNTDDFIKSKMEAGLDEKSAIQYRQNLKRLRAHFAEMELAEITEQNLVDYIESLKSDGFTLTSINQHITTIRGFFSYCEKELKIQNPANRLKIFKIDRKEGAVDEDKVKGFYSMLTSDKEINPLYRLIILLLIRFGINGATICNLTLKDLLYDGKLFTLNLPHNKRVTIDQNEGELYSLFLEYYKERTIMQASHDNLFLSSQGRPFSRPHIIYILKIATKKFKIENLSLVSLTNLASSLEEIKRGDIIENKYKIIISIERNEKWKRYKVVDIREKNKVLLLTIYTFDEKVAGREELTGYLNRIKEITHQFISPIIDFGFLKGQAFFVVEKYFNYKRLSDFVKKLSVTEVKKISESLLSAISYMHDKGIVHGEITLQNILISRKQKIFTPLIVNFNPLHKFFGLTGNEQPNYFPQVLTSTSKPDEGTDLYNLGVTLYYLISGRFPYGALESEGGDDNTLIELADLATQFPKEFCNIIMRMVTKKSGQRFPCASEILNLIKDSLSIKYHELKKVKFDIPIDNEKLSELSLIVKDLMNKDSRVKSLIILKGPNGSGKVFFVNELTNTAKIESIPVINIRCSENMGSIFLFDALSGECRDEHLLKYNILDGLYSHLDFDSEQRRTAFFEKALALIAEKSPLLIIIEDGEMASNDLCEMVLFIARGIIHKSIKALLLFTINAESQATNNLFNMLNSEIEEKHSCNLALSPFNKDELSLFLRDIWGDRIGEDAIEKFYFLTGGRREEVYEIVQKIRGKGALVIGNSIDESLLLDLNSKKPPELFLALPPEESTILSILSCLGRRATLLELNSIFFEYKKNILLNFNNLINNLADKGYIQITIENGTKYISLPADFPHEKYSEMVTDRDDIHRVIAHDILEKKRFNTNKIVELTDHLLKCAEYSRALVNFLYLIEESVMNGLLFDGLNFVYRAREIQQKLQKKEILYLSLWQVRILTHLYRLDEAAVEIEYLQNNLDCDPGLFVFHKSKFLIRIGNLAAAKVLLANSLFDQKITVNKEIEIQLRMLYSSVLMMVGKYEDGLLIIKESLKKNILKRSHQMRLKFLNLYAMCSNYKSNEKEALKILQGVESESCKLGFIQLGITANHDMALIYYQLLNFKMAVLAYKKALSLFEKHSDIVRKAITINGLAAAYFRAGDFRETLKYYNEALAIYDVTGKTLGYEELTASVGWFYFNIGDMENASKFCNLSYEQAETRSNNRIMGYCNLLFGKILKIRGSIKEALEKYEEAIEIFTRYNNKREIAQVKLSKAELLTAIGELKESQKILFSIKTRVSDDISVRFLIEETRLMLSLGNAKNDEIERRLKKIKDSPLAKEDWEIILIYHGLSFLFYKRNKKDDRARDEIAFLKKKMGGLAKGLPPNNRVTFLAKSEFAELFFRHDDTKKEISHEKLFDINFNISSILSEELLFDRIIKYFILLAGTTNGAILVVGEGKITSVAARDKNGLNIKIDPQSLAKAIFRSPIDKDSFLFKRVGVDENSGNFIAFPFFFEEKPLGFLFGEYYNDAKKPDERLENILKLFAVQAGISIVNARNHQKLKNEIQNLIKEKENFEKKSLSELERVKSLDQEVKRTRGYLYLEERRIAFAYENIVGRSHKMRELISLVERVALSDVPLLITGESGTGKELIARAVHKTGLRKNNPFIAENCAAMTETLLESELFGHVRGSFTGAISDQAGIFEIADGGTVFLDEIGEMTLSMQTKLLRVLQDGEIRRIGDRKTRRVNVRVISATNRDIKSMLLSGHFREDLYYRLNVFSIKIPPLRERREDIPDLAYYFIERHGKRENRRIEIDYEVIEHFKKRDWMGNVRELENEIARLTILSEGKGITMDIVNSVQR